MSDAEVQDVESTLAKIPDRIVKDLTQEKLDFLLADIEFNEN